jgi:phosphoribosylformylglycinamidine cyclo-ligase
LALARSHPVGLIMVVAEHYAEAIVRRLIHRAAIPAWIIGEVVPGAKQVVWD